MKPQQQIEVQQPAQPALSAAATTAAATAANAAPAEAPLFRDRNFLWLGSGAFLSNLGDQFSLIALPWLVLQTTGDSFKLGLTLALTGIPRALLMLFGGAVIDQYTPKTVIQLTKYLNAGLLIVFAALVYSGYTAYPIIALFALILGISTAFSIPAGPALMPHVLAPAKLAAANAMLLGIRQLSMVAGPLLAGLLLWLADLSKGQHSLNLTGLSLAFLFDGLTYAISIWTLEQVRFLTVVAPAERSGASAWQKLWQELRDGLGFCWNLLQLRHFFMYMAAIALLTMGPLQVLMPLLVERLGQSASLLGLLAAAHGAGSLVGMAVAGILPGLRFGNLGKTLLLIDACVAICFIPLGLIKHSLVLAGLLFCVGCLGGYLQVAVFTWIQRQVPRHYLGRTMSVFMFIFMGVAPVAAGLTGFVLRYLAVPQLIMLAGAGLLMVVLIAAWKSSLRHLQDCN